MNKSVCFFFNIFTIDETDSYMYQSVGSNVVKCICDAMNIPLFTREIKGTSKSTESIEYSQTEGDEVEDLFLLLKDILKFDNSIKAITCGAILSDYQRFRVESVCARLGLLVIAPLWNRGQVELLQEMIDMGLKAILAKCACYGLNGNHVEQSIADLKPYFMKLRSSSGMFVCGEGGEYETLCLENALMQSGTGVDLQNTTKIVHHACEIAPSVLLISQNPTVSHALDKDEPVDLPRRLQEFMSIIAYLRDSGLYSIPNEANNFLDGTQEFKFLCNKSIFEGKNAPLPFPFADRPSCEYPAVSIIMSPWIISAKSAVSLEDQARSVFSRLVEEYLLKDSSRNQTEGNGELTQHQFKVPYFVEIQVSNMQDFAVVNGIYVNSQVTSYFPPARACVETLMVDADVKVKARVISASCSKSSTSFLKSESIIKVDSLSTWATSAVGPYSQFVPPCFSCELPSRHQSLYVSGTIGLVPHSLALPCLPLQKNIHPHALLAIQKMQAFGRLNSNIALVNPALTEDEKPYPQWIRKLISSANDMHDQILAEAIIQLSFALRSMRLVLQRSYGKRNGDGDFLPRFGYLNKLVGSMLLFGSKKLAADGEDTLKRRMKVLESVLMKLCLLDLLRLNNGWAADIDDEKMQIEISREYDNDFERTDCPDMDVCMKVLDSRSSSELNNILNGSVVSPLVSSVVVGMLPKDALVEIIPFITIDQKAIKEEKIDFWGAMPAKGVYKTFRMEGDIGCDDNVSCLLGYSNEIDSRFNAFQSSCLAVMAIRVKSILSENWDSAILSYINDIETQSNIIPTKRIWIFAKNGLHCNENLSKLSEELNADITPVLRITDDSEVEIIINYLYI